MSGRSIGDVFGTALAVMLSATIVAAIGVVALVVWGLSVWFR